MVWSRSDGLEWREGFEAASIFTQLLNDQIEQQDAVYAEIVASHNFTLSISAKTIIDPHQDPTALQDSVMREIINLAHDSWVEDRPLLRRIQGGPDSFVDVYCEPVRAPLRLIIIGAGHVGRAVGRLAKFLGYHVVVMDERADYANPEWFGVVDEIIIGEFEAIIRDVPSDGDTYWLIMTSGHTSDGKCLAACLRKSHAYVGLLSSPRKRQMLFDRLKSSGFSDEDLAAVHTPVGLPIGSKSPEEIAISIIAEIIKIKSESRKSLRGAKERL